jgi:hypothetical protein
VDPRFNVFARIIPGKFRAPSGKLPEMECPHCGKQISETVEGPAVGSRQYLIAWLTAGGRKTGWRTRGGRYRIAASPNFRRCMRRRSAGNSIGPGAGGVARNLAAPSVGGQCSRAFPAGFFSCVATHIARTSPPARSGAPVTGVCTSGRCASSRAPTRPRWSRCQSHLRTLPLVQVLSGTPRRARATLTTSTLFRLLLRHRSARRTRGSVGVSPSIRSTL